MHRNMEAAAMFGDIDTIKYFLEQGVDINKKEPSGYPPVMWAAYNGHKEAVAFMIDHGADMNALCLHGRTPLSWAIHKNQTEVVRLLLERGAALHAEGQRDRSPLYWAREEGNPDIIRMLKEEPKRRKRLEKEKKRLENKADVLKDFLKDSPTQESLSAVIFLGADVHQVRDVLERAFWCHQPLEVTWVHVNSALQREDRELLRLLIARGAVPGEEELAALDKKQLALLYQCGWMPASSARRPPPPGGPGR